MRVDWSIKNQIIGTTQRGDSEGASEPRPGLMAGAQRVKPSESETPLEANGAFPQMVRPSETTRLSRWPAGRWRVECLTPPGTPPLPGSPVRTRLCAPVVSFAELELLVTELATEQSPSSRLTPRIGDAGRIGTR